MSLGSLLTVAEAVDRRPRSVRRMAIFDGKAPAQRKPCRSLKRATHPGAQLRRLPVNPSFVRKAASACPDFLHLLPPLALFPFAFPTDS